MPKADFLVVRSQKQSVFFSLNKFKQMTEASTFPIFPFPHPKACFWKLDFFPPPPPPPPPLPPASNPTRIFSACFSRLTPSSPQVTPREHGGQRLESLHSFLIVTDVHMWTWSHLQNFLVIVRVTQKFLFPVLVSRQTRTHAHTGQQNSREAKQSKATLLLLLKAAITSSNSSSSSSNTSSSSSSCSHPFSFSPSLPLLYHDKSKTPGEEKLLLVKFKQKFLVHIFLV